MRIIMMGTGTFAEPTFQALLTSAHEVLGLVTQPERPIGQERASTRQTGMGMSAIARERSVPVFQPDSINTAGGMTGLQAFKPDLLVVAAYGQILSKEVLAVPAQGGINVHASLLPKYRGAAPVAWAIYHGETRTGVTIIRMSVSLDAGDVLAQEAVEIGPEETAGELESRLALLGAKLTVQVVEQIASGTVKGVKQDKSQATKAPKLTKEHGLIDWSRPGRDICNQIRAMQPWPTAYSFLHRQGQKPLRVLIHRATWRESVSENRTPGETLVDDSARLSVVADGRSLVEVLELQPAGKRRMSAAEFLRGHPLDSADRFGSGSPGTGPIG